MCLSAIAIGQNTRFPFVVAANRDEFFERPTGALEWWTPDGSGTPVLSGRDLEAGGTWMGLNPRGRFAMLTNVRDPRRNDPTAPTRGKIVTDWLTTAESTDRFWARTALSGHNGFNLIAIDFAQGDCFWASNTAPHTQRLRTGLYGVSNGLLDTPWPKVEALKSAMRRGLNDSSRVDQLAESLFEALADRSPAPDADLPSTGVPLELERRLSPAFIHMPERGYGTRCSTLLITEVVGSKHVTHVHERSFHADGSTADTRVVPLPDWPPADASGHAALTGMLGAAALPPPDTHSPDYSERVISTCSMPASSNTSPRGTKPARR